MALVTQDLTELDQPVSGAKTNSPLDWSWENPGFSVASGLLLWPDGGLRALWELF